MGQGNKGNPPVYKQIHVAYGIWRSWEESQMCGFKSLLQHLHGARLSTPAVP
jgi:hypothetical protein